MLSIFTLLCSQSLDHFSSCETKTLSPFYDNSPLHPSLQPLENHHFAFCLYNLITLRSSQKWNHAVFVFLLLAEVT